MQATEQHPCTQGGAGQGGAENALASLQWHSPPTHTHKLSFPSLFAPGGGADFHPSPPLSVFSLIFLFFLSLSFKKPATLKKPLPRAPVERGPLPSKAVLPLQEKPGPALASTVAPPLAWFPPKHTHQPPPPDLQRSGSPCPRQEGRPPSLRATRGGRGSAAAQIMERGPSFRGGQKNT